MIEIKYHNGFIALSKEEGTYHATKIYTEDETIGHCLRDFVKLYEDGFKRVRI